MCAHNFPINACASSARRLGHARGTFPNLEAPLAEMADEQSEVMETGEPEAGEPETEAPPPPEEPSEPLPEWGEDVSTEKDGGLFKKILLEGSEEDGPLKSDEVFVHYTGRLLNGEVFDSSVERGEPFKFKLGMGTVIKGWDVGVATMKKGEKCILTCRPSYGYGEAGSPPKIPGNTTLQFEVELLSWKGEDVSRDGGVMKSIITEGKDYSRPNDGARCNGEEHVSAMYTCHGAIQVPGQLSACEL